MTNTTLQTITAQRIQQKRVLEAQHLYKLLKCSQYWLNVFVKSGEISQAEAGWILTQTNKGQVII